MLFCRYNDLLICYIKKTVNCFLVITNYYSVITRKLSTVQQPSTSKKSVTITELSSADQERQISRGPLRERRILGKMCTNRETKTISSSGRMGLGRFRQELRDKPSFVLNRRKVPYFPQKAGQRQSMEKIKRLTWEMQKILSSLWNLQETRWMTPKQVRYDA